MYILGLHDGHCATACLLKDGKILACASEERFTGNKNESGIPKKAIEYCLKEAGIKIEDIDKVVLASIFMAPVPSRMYSISDKRKSAFSGIYMAAQRLRRGLYKTPKFHDSIYKAFSPAFYKKSAKERIKNLVSSLKIDKQKIILQGHHECHAYTALYGSDLLQQDKDFLVLTLDGEGDGLCATVNIVKNKKMRRISQTSNAYSIGLLYGNVTRYLGMKILEHEYKVMGLAPYVQEKDLERSYNLLKDLIYVQGLKFRGKVHSHIYLDILQQRLKFQRFDWISGAIQKLTEDLIIKWIKNAVKATGIKNIALAGGVFMNVKANMKLMNLPEIKEFFVFPSCGDESLAIGACYYGYELACKEKQKIVEITPIKNLYLGPEFNNEQIKEALKECKAEKKYKIEICQNIEKRIAELLVKGKIVARCSGKMEWGARALGNRSILADASRFEVIKEINEAIKSRDFWMPFAPVIMKEAEHEYIINNKKVDAPWMILAFDSTTKARKDIVAAMHQYDMTVRPQIIKKDSNQSYHKIIKIFRQKTGMGGMLNTSFNLHGYPIVLGPKEALYVFENSDLKYLVMNNYLVSKK